MLATVPIDSLSCFLPLLVFLSGISRKLRECCHVRRLINAQLQSGGWSDGYVQSTTKLSSFDGHWIFELLTHSFGVIS